MYPMRSAGSRRCPCRTGKDELLETAMALHDAAIKDEYFVKRRLAPNVDFWYVCSFITLRIYLLRSSFSKTSGGEFFFFPASGNSVKIVSRSGLIYRAMGKWRIQGAITSSRSARFPPRLFPGPICRAPRGGLVGSLATGVFNRDKLGDLSV